ncbi:MAG: hypothetical protein QXG86_03635 [Candidatus Woesearchaeota archaeon]
MKDYKTNFIKNNYAEIEKHRKKSISKKIKEYSFGYFVIIALIGGSSLLATKRMDKQYYNFIKILENSPKTIYVVKEGDTLIGLADEEGCDYNKAFYFAEYVKKINNIRGVLKKDLIIKIPSLNGNCGDSLEEKLMDKNKKIY